MAAVEDQVVPVPRVLIGNISRGSISTAMALGTIKSLITGAAVSVIMVESGPYLDAGRNKALANGFRVTTDGIHDLPHSHPLAWDWFLFIDSDIEFTEEHIVTLFEPTRHAAFDPLTYPVISGVYVNPFDDEGVPGEGDDENGGHAGHFGPVVYEWTTRTDLLGNRNGIPTETFRRLSRKALATLPPVDEPWNPPSPDGASPSPVCKVAAVGAGFLAIHVSLLQEMQRTYPEPMVWFDEPIVNEVHYGEDFGFALRVMELGYPVLVNRACTPLHHKTTKLV